MKLLAWFNNIPIYSKAWIMAVPLVVQVGLMVTLWGFHLHLVSSQEVSDRSEALVRAGEGAYSSVTSWHNAMLAYAFSPTEENLQRLTHIGVEAENELNFLPELARDDPEQRGNFEALQVSFQQLRALAQSFTNLLRNGETERALDFVRDFRVGRHIASLRTQLDKFVEVEQRRASRFAADLQSASRRAAEILTIGAVLTFISVALAIWALGYSITKRLRTISEHISEIQDGKHPSPQVTGADEIGRLDSTLHSMSSALREKALEIELFVYSVSHDLRSPLVNLEGFSKELQDSFSQVADRIKKCPMSEEELERITKVIDKEIPHSLHFISSAVQRISSIINALLRLSRAGRVDYRIEQVDLNLIVEKVIAAAHHLLKSKGIEVKCGPLPLVNTDASAVEQAFGNLIVNAAQYSDPKKEQRTLSISEVADPTGSSELAVIAVRDNGLGIPREALRKLFLAFQRFHTSVSPGEGIGLAMVRRIITRLGGKIWVESREGEGACFFIAIPRKYARGIEPKFEDAIFDPIPAKKGNA